MTNAHSFFPSAETSREFRDALGKFATGITVVTALTKSGEPIGITANSFASVSLDPALVLWSPAKSSSRYQIFTEAKHFAIHVLSDAQEDVCRAFVADGAAFYQFDCINSEHGLMLLENCLARFECNRNAVHDAGDHAIIVGKVTRATVHNGKPLLFSAGKYGLFDSKV